MPRPAQGEDMKRGRKFTRAHLPKAVAMLGKLKPIPVDSGEGGEGKYRLIWRSND